MTATVDVLAVMDKTVNDAARAVWWAETVEQATRLVAEEAALREARAAVAELVEAGRRIQETRSGADADPGSVAMMRWDAACEQFDAALAKFGVE